MFCKKERDLRTSSHKPVLKAWSNRKVRAAFARHAAFVLRTLLAEIQSHASPRKWHGDRRMSISIPAAAAAGSKQGELEADRLFALREHRCGSE